jgi:hypothetical protein
MNTININPLHPAYTELVQEAISQGYTIACAQRPLNGLKTWESSSIGNGNYYAYGNLNQFKSVWEFLDATIITIQTNEDIENIIKAEIIKEGLQLDEILKDNTFSELAESFELCYID